MLVPVRKHTLMLIIAVLVTQAVTLETSESTASLRSGAGSTLLPNQIIDRSSHHHTHVDPTFSGIWKKNIVWKPRWVKTWQEKKVFVAVWKRMWGPAVINEWVPVAKPPPGWVKHGHHDVHINHEVHEHPVLKHTSYGVPIHP